MKVILAAFVCAAAGLLLVHPAQAQEKKVDPTGKWTWTAEGRNGQVRTNTITLKLEGTKLTGTILGRRQQGPTETPIEDAMLKGDEVSFKVTREFNGNRMVSKYTAKISGDTMKGKMSFDRGGDVTEREFEAKREPAKK